MSQVEEKTTTTGTVDAADSNRRNFLLTLFGTAGLAAIAATPAGKMLDEQTDVSVFTIAQQTGLVPEIDTDADVITRMNGDLARALQKQPAERRWVMVIDLRKCVGCHACTIACVVKTSCRPASFTAPSWKKSGAPTPTLDAVLCPAPVCSVKIRPACPFAPLAQPTPTKKASSR